MLHINDLVCRIGGRALIDGASLHIPEGQRVGLVGRNGAGKSTLFRVIRGDRAPDGGAIAVRPRARVGEVAQDAPDGPQTVLDCVLAADTERATLLARLDEEPAPDPQTLAEIHERLTVIDAHAAPARAAAILSGLGFGPEAQDQALATFSGGWRMRVALAAALFARPDLLLLDEPTNHLDLEATLWLEGFLASYPGTLLIISHDRDLLNRAVQRIVHLERGKLVSYLGGFDTFERTRRERQEHQAKQAARQAEERRHMEAFVARFRAKASKARQAQSRLKMLERLPEPQAVVEEAVVPFTFPDPETLPPPLIALEDGVAGYDGRPVLRELSLRLDMDDRVALLGANGNGKSTLAKVLAGRLALMAGDLRASSKLRVGYFAQHQLEELRPQETPLQHGRRLMPDLADQKVRAHLGRFGFGEGRVTTPVDLLSGGEKARLLIALTCRSAPHLLILDEPTNHLDIDSRDSLMRALNEFGGAVVLVSHDPRLVELVADRLWLVDDGRVTPFDGDMDDYRRFLLDRARDARRAARGEDDGSGGGGAAAGDGAAEPRQKDRRRAAAEARSRLAPLRKAAEAAEKRVDQWSAKKAALEERLARPDLYDGPPEQVTALQIDLGAAEKALAEAEDAWMAAQEALDVATAQEPALAGGG